MSFMGSCSSGVVWLAFGVAAYWAALGCLMITLYLSWSPWHYGAQNFGLCLMFLGRAGVRLPSAGRRLLFASFVLSVALTLLNFHRVLSVGGADPMFDPGSAYRFVPLGIPESVARAAFPALLAVYAAGLAASSPGCSGGAPLRALLPGGRDRLCRRRLVRDPRRLGHGPPGPSNAWARRWPSSGSPWGTACSTSGSPATTRAADGSGQAFWGTRVLLAGAAIWVLPALAFAPGALGRVPFEAGLGLLVAAAVNLHHFVLDGAIWKLRDPRVGRGPGGRRPRDHPG